MDIKIISEELVQKGKLITVKVGEEIKKILFTFHLLDSLKEYKFQTKDVLNFILRPDEVVIGHGGRFIAHKALNGYIVRIVYEYEGDLPVVITLYVANKGRYWKGGGTYADKILS